MKVFVVFLVRCLQPSTNVTENFILGVAGVLDPPLELYNSITCSKICAGVQMPRLAYMQQQVQESFFRLTLFSVTEKPIAAYMQLRLDVPHQLKVYVCE